MTTNLKQLGQLTGLMIKRSADPYYTPAERQRIADRYQRVEDRPHGVPMWKQYGRIAPGAMAPKKLQRLSLPGYEEEQFVPYGPGVAAPRGIFDASYDARRWPQPHSSFGTSNENPWSLSYDREQWYKPGLSKRPGHPGGSAYERHLDDLDVERRQQTIPPWHPNASWNLKDTLGNWAAWLRKGKAR